MSDGIDWRRNGSSSATATAALQSPFHGQVLAGRRALVTGGGSGIGLEVAKQLGLHGARVAIMGRTASKLQEAEQQLRSAGVGEVLCVQGDVRDAASGAAAVRQVAERWGGLDILVNNAAGNFLCLAEDLSVGGFKAVVDIDLVGTFAMSRAALEQLKKAPHGGVVLNMSATLHYGATPYVLHAAAAKAGVDALTRGLAVEWREHGIRVVGIAPGPVADTEGMARLAPKEYAASAQIPMVDKAEIGLAAVYLCCEAARSISGDTLVVDAGTTYMKPGTVPREFYDTHIKPKLPKPKL